MTRTAACCAAVTCMAAPLLSIPAVHARGEGDTHITGVGIEQTIDCNNGTLFVLGSKNIITAEGVCFAVTVQGSDNVVIADTVLNDITVYGSGQTVTFHNGDPAITDRGRELGMTNRIDHSPA